MKIFKVLLFIGLFTSACDVRSSLGQQETKSKSPKETTSEKSTPSSGGDSSSNGGGSSSSDSSNKNNQPSSPVTPVTEELTFSSNILTTPLFKMHYQDDEAKSSKKKNDAEKITFLKHFYNKFKNDATYSNEVYALKKIVFNQVDDLTGRYAKGQYSVDNKTIIINFDNNASYDAINTILLHEYYHHLSFIRMQKMLTSWSGKNILSNSIEEYTYNEYLKLLNEAKTRLSQNYFDSNDKYFPYLQGLTFEHETEQYYANYFSKNQKERWITFDPKDLKKRKQNGDVFTGFFSYYAGYVNSNAEFIARSMNLYTQVIKPNEDGLIKADGLILTDYLMQLFLRTNLYYNYTNLKRPFPLLVKSLRNDNRFPYYIPRDNLLKWVDVKVFNEKSRALMESKYREWKNYFENILFNQDQVLANAFVDLDGHLYLELNDPNQKITFEDAITNESVTVLVQKLPSHGNLTFNLFPFQNQQKTPLNLHPFRIFKSYLTKGVYNIKLNDSYLSIDQGLELANLKHKRKNLWIVDKSTYNAASGQYDDVELKYSFFIRNDKLVLEVL